MDCNIIKLLKSVRSAMTVISTETGRHVSCVTCTNWRNSITKQKASKNTNKGALRHTETKTLIVLSSKTTAVHIKEKYVLHAVITLSSDIMMSVGSVFKKIWTTRVFLNSNRRKPGYLVDHRTSCCKI
jgi:hypothetical protein